MKRRWLQYSMRTILVAMTVVCVWLGFVANRANRQRRATEAILAGGSRVLYDWQEDAGWPDEMEFPGFRSMRVVQRIDDAATKSGPRPTFRVIYEPVEEDYPSAEELGVPRWLRDWLGPHYFHKVVAVDFFGAHFDDERTRLLADLPHLRRLDVTGSGLENAPERLPPLPRLEELLGVAFTRTQLPLLEQFPNLHEVRVAGKLTDEDLQHFAGLTHLRRLNLTGCPLEGHGLAHLAALTELEELNLTGTEVDDADLAHLAHLTALKRLTLANTAVTDAGLAHLRGLINLVWLQLHGTQVTREGVERLDDALPGHPIVR